MKFRERLSELLNKPACLWPSAMMTAPVSVDSQISFFTWYFYWVQFMQSARTSRPSASVFPIQTAIPFLDFIISRGRYEFELTKFQTKPIETVRLIFSFSLAILSIALNTDAAPCLSICIYLIPVVGLRLSPPESKQTPLPTKDVHSVDSGLPLQAKFIKIGYFSLALPTACINLNPSSISCLPLKTVIFRL